MKLWDDFDGVPYLVNPRLFLLNKPKRKKRKTSSTRKRGTAMARRSQPRHRSGPKKGQFKKRATAKRRPAARTTRRKRVRRVRSRAKRVMIVRNPRRRRRSYAAPARRRRRSYKRNPSMGSLTAPFTKFLSGPTLKTVGYTVAGVAGTPFLEGFIVKMLPASFQTKWVGYGVKILSAWGVGTIVSKVAGREAGRAAYIGGAVYVALGLFRDFVPGVLPSTGLGRYIGTGAQPMLGKYSGTSSYATMGTPDRLQPSMRF